MDMVNFPDGFRPKGSDFLKREENKAAEFSRVRSQLGRGVAEGLQLTRQSNGSVTLSAGHGNDAAGHAIVARTAQTLDLSSIALPATGKFRYVAVLLEYKQLEQGQAQGAAAGTWAERKDSCVIRFLAGRDAVSEAAAVPPKNSSTALRVGDILFDDNGTRSVDDTLEDKGLSERIVWAQDEVSPLWKLRVFYPAGRLILKNGIEYLCTQNHRATAANAPDQAGAPWAFLATDASIAAAIAAAIVTAGSNADAKVLAALKKNNPVDKLWISKDNTNPRSILGFGTWAAMGKDYYLVSAGNWYKVDGGDGNGYYDEELPNIEGTARNFLTLTGSPVGSGALSVTGVTNYGLSGSGAESYATIEMDASDYNSIYRKSPQQTGLSAVHVTPYTVARYFFERTA